MTQPGLIKKIVEATSLQGCTAKHTPATPECLGSDPDGEPMNENWSYSSVVGMLLYLSTNTRPDIAFAVSQVARFSSNPKQSHAAAVKRIVRYLAHTVNKGTIFTPKAEEYRLDCYVDADFAGLHGREPEDNPTSAKSRTGYIVYFCGCPLIWKSQLQTETALSTFHAEYVALSSAARAIISLQRVLKEILDVLEEDGAPPRILAIMHEDNQSAYFLANRQQLSSRSKHLNIKWHHFWEQVNSGDLEVSKIDTKDQRADYLTKGLVQEDFERIRRYAQGW